ncbi:MAG: SCO family protein [Actinomycetota bacterium]|nr:SCO family protein [Actinomycetota bacterium]
MGVETYAFCATLRNTDGSHLDDLDGRPMSADASCSSMREALSAVIDGEDPSMDRAVLDSHVSRCRDCRRFTERSQALARRIRVRRAEPVPDTTAGIVEAIAPGPAPRPSGRGVPLRVLAAAAVAVVVLAGVAFAGGRLLRGSGPAAANCGGGETVACTQVAGSTQQNALYPGATVLPVSYTKPDITLTDTSGQPFNLAAQTAGTIALVYFGYTNCPDACPINMALTAQTLRRLPAADRARIKVVFVTTDPVRDTPPVIRAWLNNFDPSFIGLAGTEDQIHQAERGVGMPLSYADTPQNDAKSATSAPGKDTNYQVVHAGYTLVYTPDGVAHLQIDDTEQPSRFATTLQHLLAHGYQA